MDKPLTSKGKVTFPVPADFDLGDREPGDKLQVLADLKVEADGKLCLVAIDGIPLGAYEAPAEPAGFVASVEAGLGQGGDY